MKHVSWKELELKIESLSTEESRGEVFDQFVFAYLNLQSDYYQLNSVYRAKDIPLRYRELLKLEKTDWGVDGIFILQNGKIAAYQSKFRSHRASPTTRELSTFWAEGEYSSYRYIISNAEALPKPAHKKKDHQQILSDTFDKLDIEFFENFHRFCLGQQPKKRTRLTPDPHQSKMISEIIKGFETSDRGKLIAACGVGKTLTSLWSIERLKAKLVLFVTPSLSLIRQTLEEWTKQSQEKLSYLCVCSDVSVVAREEQDIGDYEVSELDFPVTTSPQIISNFLATESNFKVIFSTYNSVQSIVDALKINRYEFDIIIFDEAHRTAGSSDHGMFSIALDGDKIKSKKRLFMTATERLVRPWVIEAAAAYNRLIFSMDDETIYGKVFARYTFGEAIKDKVIADYKIIVSAVNEEEVESFIQNNRLLDNSQSDAEIISAENYYKQLILCKAMKKYNLNKTISFHSSVKRAKEFVSGRQGVYLKLEEVMKQIWNSIPSNHYLDTVNGKMSAGERNQRLGEFESCSIGVISNARCLTEGVDIPVIDSVYFVDPKTSQIDIVQACGRALRKSRSNHKRKFSHFIVPLIINNNQNVEEIDDINFVGLYNVLQALKDQDERVEEWISQINLGIASGKGSSRNYESPLEIDLPTTFDLEKFRRSIEVRIAKINVANKQSSVTFARLRNERESRHPKIFQPLGDYNWETYRDKLVLPTIQKFNNINDQITPNRLKINHNNISHTERLALIEIGSSSYYKLTNIGKQFKENKIVFEEVFRRAMLYHSKKSASGVLYPYRVALDLLMRLSSFNYIEFLFGVYTMTDSNQESVIKAYDIIKEIRTNYPRIDILNKPNKIKVLQELNRKYNQSFIEAEAWGSTTTKNKFGYFRNHLTLIKGVELGKERINIQESNKPGIREILDKLRC